MWWGAVAVGVWWGAVRFSSKRFASMCCASGLLQDSDIDDVCQVRCTLRMQCLGVATARNQGTGCDTLTDDEFDATHADETCTCSLAGCLQCAFIRKRPILRARCLIKLPGLTTPTTWLSFKNGGVGCIVCNAAGFAGSSRGDYGRFSGGPTSLNLYRLWRHGQGPQHCQALKMLGGKAISRTRKVPSAEALKSTWQAIRKGSVRLKSKRGRREEFVLAESIRLLHREFLGEAASISLGCDERRDRLLVRFTAVHPRTMRVRSGTLGLERHFGKGAPAIKRALKAVLNRFCCHGLFLL